MLGWLRDRMQKSADQAFALRMAKVGHKIEERGFYVDSKRVNVGEMGIRATRHATVGLWSACLPELVGYGPVGGMTEEVLQMTVLAYIEASMFPEDGDEVFAEGQCWQLREVDGIDNKARVFDTSAVAWNTFPELYAGVQHVRGFQLIGSWEPPERLHREGPPAISRRIPSVQQMDWHKLTGMTRALRQESMRIVARKQTVAP